MFDNPDAVTGIAVTDNVALITINKLDGNLALVPKIFARIAERDINVDMISLTPPYKSKVTLSFTVGSDFVGEAIALVGRFKEKIPGISCDISDGNSKLTISGAGMRETVGVAADVLDTVMGAGIEVKLITTAEDEISLLVSDADVDTAYRGLCQKYFS